ESPGTETEPPEYSIEEDIPEGIEKSRVEEYALELRNLADGYRLRCGWIITRPKFPLIVCSQDEAKSSAESSQ
ncbi:hypothetical protein KKA94_04390, partial [Patescibacteria group bacterium]|nr:hypothetical protein [Patescibacteria group bacterium]